MSAHTRGPRGGRPRKPRPADRTANGTAPEGGAEQPTDSRPRADSRRGAAGAQTRSRADRRAGARSVPAYRDFEGRPQAPWHPLPLSELLIVIGAIAFAVAMVRLGNHGFKATAPLLAAGVLALGLGTAEVSWREHRTGFRSHTLLLAFIPVLALHTLVVVGYSTVATPSRALNLGMLVVDVAVFALLARRLRKLFADARAARR
jgi:hypothetical protein